MDEISGIYRHGLKMALRKLSYRAQGICAQVRRHAMRRIDEALIALGLFWLLAALVLPAFQVGQLSPPAGFVLSAMIWGSAIPVMLGVISRLVPAIRTSKLAKPMFWALAAGSSLLAANQLIPHPDLTIDAAAFGSIVLACGVILFAIAFYQGRTPRA